MVGWYRSIETLREPLRSAARDGFALLSASLGQSRGATLAESLRTACDQVIAAQSPNEAEFRSWRLALETFEHRDPDQQAVEIARGLRLCHWAAGAAPSVERGAGANGLQVLSGIGPALAAKFAERGFYDVEDLLWHLPRRYDDVRNPIPLGKALVDLSSGTRQTLYARVHSCRFGRRGRRRWVDLRLCDDDDEPSLVVRWFHAYPGMTKRFPKYARVVLSGVVRRRGDAWEMANPDVVSVEIVGGDTTKLDHNIIPRYPDVVGVPAGTVRKACRGAVGLVGSGVQSAVPASVCEALDLPSLADALIALHQPTDDLSPAQINMLDQGQSIWHRRLAFEELFVHGLAIAKRRHALRSDLAFGYRHHKRQTDALAHGFPFVLTSAQRRAIEVLSRDLAKPIPMNRLLQGDVGSGKTAVAFAAAHQVTRAGGQVAMMAPTEILAEQHYATLAPWCAAQNMSIALLTASTPKGVKVSTASLLAAGKIDLVVGTHSLLSESVAFSQLGLVVVDEQHRFGVAQRARLRRKGAQFTPHLLVMTATPIPRTLALAVYGDLDVTVLGELPPGRKPVRTQVFSGASGRKKAYKLVQARVATGERVFVVCPLIDACEDDSSRQNWADATSVAEELRGALKGVSVGLVHGRMPHEQRREQMAALRSGEIRVLVSTTLVEVGVDVPAATVMVIEDAHHFGLSQLHQLRGRVGRGGGDAHCLLLTRGRKTEAGARRLAVMAESTDGFFLAEEDLKLRGPGELTGVRQAGLPRFRFGDIRQHTELLVLAREHADQILIADPELALEQHQCCKDALLPQCSQQLYGAEGG